MSLTSKGLKTIAICVLVAFVTVSFRVDLLVAATRSNAQSPAQTEVTSAGQFQDLLKDTEKLLEGMETDLGARKTVSAKLKDLKKNKSELQDLAGTIRSEFDKTREELLSKKLPPEIIQRHDAFDQNFEVNLKALFANLDGAEQAKKKQLKKRVKAARDHLNKNIYKKRHIPLDPDKLPHRRSDLKPRKPITDPKEFKKLFPKNQQSSVSQGTVLSSILGVGTAYAQEDPIDPDLAETIEVQFTQEIQDLAASLNHDPVNIYEWVRNNIEFVPTYGSIQGAQMCLLTKQGNAFDISSLLIALLRVSNIKARYVYGTIEVPIDKVMNWVGGFTDAKSAADFIASGGIPVTAVISGGKITKARMEHVWVEAWIDYIPSRGARHKTGQGDMWIPLDASFKQYAYTEGIDIKTAVPFDTEAFINQIESTAIIDTANNSVTGVDSVYIQQQAQDYNTQVQLYMTQNYPNATVEDFLGKKEIVKQEFPYLLGTLPYKLLITGAKYAEIPDNLRHKLSFIVIKDINDTDLGTPINITKSLPELAGKKITLSYSPATPADESVITSYLPKPHPDGTPIQPNELPTSLPSYLINLKPELKIDGLVMATGTSVGMGNTEIFNMTFTSPGVEPDVIRNEIQAGNYLGIALDLGRISQEQLDALKENLELTKTKLQEQDISAITKEDILGDRLYTTALAYHAKHDLIKHVVSRTTNVVAFTLPSVAIFSFELKTNFFFGIPKSASAGGLAMDADRLLTIVKAVDGSKDRPRRFMLNLGVHGSELERSVPEQLFSAPDNPVQGISAVTALRIANDQGIPLYTINQSNINAILPQLQLDSDTISDIQNAVNAGKIVTVSKTNISFNGWTGCGYIIIDPNTGSGAYMISGGTNGGWLFWVGLGLIILAIVLIGVICVVSGICAAIALALASAFTALIAALNSLILWLAAFATTAYISASAYIDLMFLFTFIALAWGCFLGIPGPPDEYTLYCAMIMTILYYLVI